MSNTQLLADELSEREIHDRDPCPPESRCAICWPEKRCPLCPLPFHPEMNCYTAAEMRSLRAMTRVKDADYQHVRLVYENASKLLREALDLLDLVHEELQCGDRATGHYCPNCDGSLYNIASKVLEFRKRLQHVK